MAKDYYNILGVNRNASDDEIKKAYRKLAVKLHPDKQAGKSDAEKKEAEEKFKDVNEAYDVLSNPEKKQRYDQFGTVDEDFGGGGFNPFDVFRRHMHGFGFDDDDDFFNRANRGPQKAHDIRVSVSLTLEDIYNGLTKSIRYNINKECPECHGEGGTGVETCPVCHGTGQETTVRRMGNAIFQQTTTCSHCHGYGKTVKNKCSHCCGTGIINEPHVEEINIPAGVPEGGILVKQGAGNQGHDMINGDLQIVINYNIPNNIRIDGNNVYELVNVPYYDCILGETYKVNIPKYGEKKYKIPENTQANDMINVGNYGINKGSYIVVVNLVFTSNSKDEKKLLEKIKKLYK